MTAARRRRVQPSPDSFAAEFQDALRLRAGDWLETALRSGAAESLDADELAQRAIAALPSVPSPVEDLAGPFYDTAGLVRWLRVSRQALADRVRARSLLGLPVGRGRVYPAWQFTPEGGTIPGLTAVLRALAAGTADPWTWAVWLAAPSEEHAGLPAWRWLADGNDPAVVTAAAREDAARWAA